MATYRLPLLVLHDAQGGYTAVPVEPCLGEPGMAGFGDTLASATKQMQSYLTWMLKQFPGRAPDFLDAELSHVRVTIRPEYRGEHRVYPCSEHVALQVPCVVGRQQSGLLLCSMPTLGLIFHFHEHRELKNLVAEAVRSALVGCTPQQLSRFVPPKSLHLEYVTVRSPDSLGTATGEGGPATLLRVAQAVGHPGFRKSFPHVWKREREVRDLVDRLGKERANVLLVGEPGCGKTSVLVHAVRDLERKRAEGDQAEPAARYRHWQTTAGRLVAGMKYLGQWEERCELVISELSSIDGVLCVESLMELMMLGGSGSGSSIAAFFLAYLRDGQLRMVAEATLEELEAARRLLPGFVELFQVLRLHDLTDAEMREAIHRGIELRARDAAITIEKDLGDRVFQLFRRFLPYHPLPGAASGFLKELFERARTDRLESLPVSRAVDQFTQETGLPEELIRDDCPLDMRALESHLCGQVIGQSEACHAMADIVARFKTGLNDPRRPLGVLLFCGPTGVGKTQLAKTVSQYLFGHGRMTDRLVRLDMSEYSSPYRVGRLVTKEDGTPSDFLSRVRQTPFCVVLLDEIEKAAPGVYDILLSVLDEGRLTDQYGRTTTFRSAILVMTSNLGASARGSLGLRPRREHNYEAAVRSFFRPEFFNRLDRVVTFLPLVKESCLAILHKELEELGLRHGLRKAGVRLQFTQRFVGHLLQVGFDPLFGARPLQRTLESAVVATLARFLVDHPGLRDSVVQVDMTAQGTCEISVG